MLKEYFLFLTNNIMICGIFELPLYYKLKE